ncbi:serine protease inhibitor A6-like [Aquarana catesbeiana]|uniref:serine protease inhibitor A6-like n=1 Tax=Aquarana catesbeiana TaxID=8400 RepID=UPI003CCA6066
MKTLLLLQLFIPLLLASGPFKPNQGHSYNHQWKQSTLSEAQLNFAMMLYPAIAVPAIGTPPNLFVSPLSLYITFSMLALGAQSPTRDLLLLFLDMTGTMTEEEIQEGNRKLLQVLNHPNKDMKLKIFSEVLVEKSLKILPEYQEKVAQYYSASFQSFSFSDPLIDEKTISRIVSDRTDHKIKDMYIKLYSSTLMVLLDYVVFEGQWESEFSIQNTEMRNFSRYYERPVLVPIMRQRGFYKTYKDTQNKCDVVEVPYFGNVSLLVIVPLGDPYETELNLTPQMIKGYFSSVKTSLVDLYLPRVSFNYPVNMTRILARMGLDSILNGTNTNFSGISKEKKLKVSNMGVSRHDQYLI